MSALKTTPGPWATNCSHIYAPDGAIIAVVHNPGSKASDYPLVANRDLMAAAPELYALAERAMRWFADNGCAGDLAWEIGETLAKARGEQP